MSGRGGLYSRFILFLCYAFLAILIIAKSNAWAGTDAVTIDHTTHLVLNPNVIFGPSSFLAIGNGSILTLNNGGELLGASGSIVDFSLSTLSLPSIGSNYSLSRLGFYADDPTLNLATGAFTGQVASTKDQDITKFWNGTYWVYPFLTPTTSRFTPLFFTTKKVNGGNRLTVLSVGDSLLDNKYIQLNTALYSQFGFAGFGFGQCAAVASGGCSVNTGGFNYWPNGLYVTLATSGGVVYDNNTTAPIFGDTVVFPYIKESGAGTFKLQASNDGGAYADISGATNINASNSSTVGAVFTATLGKGYWRIKAVPLTGTVHAPATPTIYDSTSTGVLRISMTYPGINLTQMTTTAAAILNPILSALPPDLTFYCNTDDVSSQQTYLGTLYSNLNTAYGATTDWVFIGISPQQDGTNDAAAVGQNSIISAFALAHNQSYFDDYSHYLSWTAANAAGLMTDGTHPNQQGRELSVGMMFQQMGFNSLLNKSVLSTASQASSPRVLPPGNGTVSGQQSWVNTSTNTSGCDTTFLGIMRKEGFFDYQVNDLITGSAIWGITVDKSSASPANLITLLGTGGAHAITIDPANGNTVVSGTLKFNGSTPVGTVSSVSLAAPSSILTVSGSPVTSTGTLTLSLANALNAANGLTQVDSNAMLPAYTSPSVAGAGTITGSGTRALVGTSTAFTTACKVGSVIQSNGGAIQATVVSITDNTHLTVDQNVTGSSLTYNILPPSFQGRTAQNSNYFSGIDGYGAIKIFADQNSDQLEWYNVSSGIRWRGYEDNSGNWYLLSSTSNGAVIYADNAAPNNALRVLSGGTTVAGTLTQGTYTSGIASFNGSGSLVPATANTDYVKPTTMTSNTTSTITFNTSKNSETIYNTSSSTIASATITLPSTGQTSSGEILTYVSNGIITTLTITGGTQLVGPTLPTTLAANTILQFQEADGNGSYVRIK